MDIKLQLNGVVEHSALPRVFKGSHNVNELTLLAPFSDEHTVVIDFELPDGSTYSDLMAYQGQIEDDGTHRWTYPINSTVTQLEGRVRVSFDVVVGDTILTTAITHFNVEDSIVFGDDIDPSGPAWSGMIELINEKVSHAELETILEEYGTGGDSTWVGSETPDPNEYIMWFDTTEEE